MTGVGPCLLALLATQVDPAGQNYQAVAPALDPADAQVSTRPDTLVGV